MRLHIRTLSSALLIAGPIAVLAASPAVYAQNDSGGFELHANKVVSAKEIGLPTYPGATAYKDPDKDAVDMGFTLGDTHFRLLAAGYLSPDSPQRILDFYRKALSRYGEVLECDHGKPVGALTKTRSGLTCDNNSDGSMKVNGTSSDGRDLRAGTPERMHIVGISEPKDGQTQFGLVYLELPKDSGKKD